MAKVAKQPITIPAIAPPPSFLLANLIDNSNCLNIWFSLKFDHTYKSFHTYLIINLVLSKKCK